jgi:hypothetical protein
MPNENEKKQVQDQNTKDKGDTTMENRKMFIVKEKVGTTIQIDQDNPPKNLPKPEGDVQAQCWWCCIFDNPTSCSYSGSSCSGNICAIYEGNQYVYEMEDYFHCQDCNGSWTETVSGGCGC